MSALAITPHLVVRDAAAAAEWYTAALGAEERGTAGRARAAS